MKKKLKSTATWEACKWMIMACSHESMLHYTSKIKENTKDLMTMHKQFARML